MNYVLAFIFTFLFSILFTLLFRIIALKLNIVDFPNQERKIHKTPIPLLGGLAVFLSFSIILIYFAFFTNLILFGFIVPKYILGIILAGLIVIIGGILDDKFDLRPRYQIIFPILATLIIIASGIGISHIRNPFGGIISFNNWQFILFWHQGIPYKITLVADFFTFIWLLGMMYTTKLLDGLDGLVSGVTIIGALIIAFVSLSNKVAQPNTAQIAIILAGAFAGFLLFNFYPAKIFLGEGGSLFAGLMLGTLAIISGSKVATTLLIMGIPILDVIWVILRRIFRKVPISFADKKHLHFRLLDIGFNQRQAVIFMYCLTALFGGISLFFSTYGKLIELVVLSIFMLILAAILVIMYKYKSVSVGQPGIRPAKDDNLTYDQKK
jgi:UDP-GlcNAc:undecaprenyl-phosphate GlcNAc-1-phosphate transferase